jgi:hypothetical protein
MLGLLNERGTFSANRDEHVIRYFTLFCIWCRIYKCYSALGPLKHHKRRVVITCADFGARKDCFLTVLYSGEVVHSLPTTLFRVALQTCTWNRYQTVRNSEPNRRSMDVLRGFVPKTDYGLLCSNSWCCSSSKIRNYCQHMVNIWSTRLSSQRWTVLRER